MSIETSFEQNVVEHLKRALIERRAPKVVSDEVNRLAELASRACSAYVDEASAICRALHSRPCSHRIWSTSTHCHLATGKVFEA